eukprot:COSAG04_NODE_1907_length_5257_cov_9.841411_8_plen_265_part_00
MAQLPPHTGGGYSDLCTHDCPPTLTDTEVLEFCKSGFIKLEAVVPSWVNEKAFARCGEIDSVPNEERGGKLPNEPSALLAEDWFVEHVIKCPAVVGAVEMIVQGVFSKVQLLVALLPVDFPLPRLHKAVAQIPRATKATALRPVPVGDHLILQPIKLGSWGGNLASHVPLEAPAAAAAAARPKKKAAAAAGGDRPLAKLRRFEAWVKRCLVSYAAEGAKRPGVEGAPLTWLDLACGRGAELEYLQVGTATCWRILLAGTRCSHR